MFFLLLKKPIYIFSWHLMRSMSLVFLCLILQLVNDLIFVLHLVEQRDQVHQIQHPYFPSLEPIWAVPEDCQHVLSDLGHPAGACETNVQPCGAQKCADSYSYSVYPYPCIVCAIGPRVLFICFWDAYIASIKRSVWKWVEVHFMYCSVSNCLPGIYFFHKILYVHPALIRDWC